MRRLIFSILTILISFSSALLLAEIALRIVWTPPTLRSTPMGETHPYYPRLPTNPEEYEAGWTLTSSYLAMLRLRAEELGSDFVVISIPGQSRVDPGARIAGIEPLAYEIEEKLDRVCAELNIRYIDLLPDMRTAPEQTQSPLYYFADRHLTPLGNQVVADVLARQLAALLRVKKDADTGAETWPELTDYGEPCRLV
jgi:hypothetical protein